MTRHLSPSLVLAAALLVGPGTPAPAQAPSASQVQSLLNKEPVNTANWSKWSERVRGWIGPDYPAAGPALDAARKFVRDSTTGTAKLPKTLEGDPVAWALLGDAYLKEGSGKDGKRF